ncbi:hypothetical protein CYMTET_40870 [Cymbomonas tetramitiformis]|uniref:Uncharacterized protein n=1 Tax=Cymbomonas tetramitiformis TaxID=36881 RepID=A0AAE0F471_9CHLO|nr:hypothetical protein CYMTET_40870 [Cymbomonas tetramitiformis]
MSNSSVAVADALLVLAGEFSADGCHLQAIKCLEAICQSQESFLPLVEVETRLRLAQLLLQHTDNFAAAKAHLERCEPLTKGLVAFDLKFRVLSETSKCYACAGLLRQQKLTIKKGLELCSLAQQHHWDHASWWDNHFTLQLANVFAAEQDFHSATQTLQKGQQQAYEMQNLEVQVTRSPAQCGLPYARGMPCPDIHGIPLSEV